MNAKLMQFRAGLNVGDAVGLVFFASASAITIARLLERPSVEGFANTFHHVVLVAVYATRRRPRDAAPDYADLALSTVAVALVVLAPWPAHTHVGIGAFALALTGQALVVWSLLHLGRSFGIAPADRGLCTRGPYRWVRHPMYLGELLLRVALLAGSLTVVNAVWLCSFAAIQVARCIREESAVRSYPAYAASVRWRLLPGVW